MDLSIVIPAYNEEKRIGKTLKETISYMDQNKHDYEIIVVDDCSKDDTFKVVKQNSNDKLRYLKNKRNRGKGYSVKRGITNANKTYVLFFDSDLATPIEMLERFIKHIDKYDILIASRNLAGSDIRTKQPKYRQMLGKVFPIIVRIFALKGFKDTQCGFKLFKAKAAKDIVKYQTFERFSFDVEILYIAKKFGYKIKELPVVWIDKEGSTLNPIKDSIKMLTDILKIRLNDMSGFYKKK